MEPATSSALVMNHMHVQQAEAQWSSVAAITSNAMLAQGTGSTTSGTALAAASLRMAHALRDAGRTTAGCSRRRMRPAAASHQSVCHCGRQLATTAASSSRWTTAYVVYIGGCNMERVTSTVNITTAATCQAMHGCSERSWVRSGLSQNRQ